MLSKLIQLLRIMKGSTGAKLSVAGQLFEFLAKNSHFSAISITFCLVLEPFERAKFLKFENHLKK